MFEGSQQTNAGISDHPRRVRTCCWNITVTKEPRGVASVCACSWSREGQPPQARGSLLEYALQPPTASSTGATVSSRIGAVLTCLPAVSAGAGTPWSLAACALFDWEALAPPPATKLSLGALGWPSGCHACSVQFSFTPPPGRSLNAVTPWGEVRSRLQQYGGSGLGPICDTLIHTDGPGFRQNSDRRPPDRSMLRLPSGAR